MKMIAGAASLRLLEEVAHAARADADDHLDELRGADIEKNGTSASPATARASSVLPVPGGRTSSTPLGAPPSRRYFSGVLQEVDDLDELLLGLVDAGHVVEGLPPPRGGGGGGG